MKTKRFLSILLSLVLVLGMLPGMSLTAYADDNTTTITPGSDDAKTGTGTMTITLKIKAAQTEELLTTITATGKEQASYNPENLASVSFSYSSGGSSAYTANWGWWGYGWTATVAPANGYTITKCVFYDDANRTATDSEAPFVVKTTEEDKTPQVNGTPILAYTSKGIKKIEVYGYATPAATHSVTITAGDHMTKTADSGEASQTGLSGAMTDVVYTADDGYYFPENYSVAAVNGISVTRNSYTQITVSGTPSADATITLTAPTAKTTPVAPTTAAATDCTTADNNDGTLTGVTTAMEYKKSDAADWTAGTGSDITGLVPGTYYVRVKATETTNASTNQELTIKGFISYTVNFKVVNGSWDEGEGEAATADKTVTLTGYEGDTLKLKAAQIPAVGSKPNDTYKAGSWDVEPSTATAITAATTYTYTYAQKNSVSQTVTFKVVNGSWNEGEGEAATADMTVTLTGYEGDTLKLTADQIPAVGSKPNDTYKAGSWDVEPSTATAITAATTYTYTYAQKDAAVVTKVPTAKTLTYNGSAQELVTAGEASGGTMQYALGTATEATGAYSESIPTATDAGTYYVWYKVKGDDSYNDSEPGVIPVSIKEEAKHQHTIVRVDEVEPGCETNGYKAHYKCKECGMLFEDNPGQVQISKKDIIIKATGHKWDDGEITKEATYDEEGIRTYTCSVCGETKTESIKKKERPSSYDDSDDSSSDDSDSGSSLSSGSSSKRYTEAQAKVDQINNVSTYSIPENHQVETGVPASDVGGRWGNNVNADTWTYTKSDGSLAKSEWLSLDYNGLRYWYYFNDDGNMHTNWFDYKGERFYLMPDKDGWRGRMATGWKNIDNKWYYFDIVPGSSQGRLYRSSVTPDGHTVGADGAWNGVGTTPVGQE